MTRLEACLLDYGNTVVEFDRGQIESLQTRFHEALCRLASPVELEVVGKTFDYIYAIPYLGDPPDYRELSPERQMQVLIAEAYGGALAVGPELLVECDRVLQELFLDAITIDSPTAEFIASLSRRVRVGLVSNYPCGKTLRRSLERTGIDRYLDPIVISGEVGYVKPHESIFLAALKELRLPPEKVLFVGDRWDADMVGAKNAGMKTCHHVGFTSDRDLDERYEKYRPDYRIERLEDIEKIFF